ncbi:MAG TPA: SdiA-regulated domain-containing protein [Gemmatimonadaceae bacterium]
MLRQFAFVLGVVALACTSPAEKKAGEERALNARAQRVEARLAKAQATDNSEDPVAMWLMPPELNEISGMTLTDDGRLLAHDDEVGRVFEVDPRRGVIVKSFLLGKGLKGDFEGITVVGPDVYMTLSNGLLYRFREGGNKASVPYTTFDTHLGKECEFEGVAHDKDSAQLVLPCKNVHMKHLDDEMVLFKWKIGSTDTTGVSMMTVPLSEVIGTNKWKKFRPSDITIDPATGNYVIISSLDKGIVVLTPGGEVVRSEPLPGKHQQAEGVAITRDNILIISDEATSKPAAITLYRWNNTESGAATQ